MLKINEQGSTYPQKEIERLQRIINSGSTSMLDEFQIRKNILTSF